jgi:hypothetical protein
VEYISPTLLEAMNEKDDSIVVPLESIRSIPATDWLDALYDDMLNTAGKKRLAAACEHHPDYLPVLQSLLERNDFGFALAREITAGENWSEYQRLITDSGIKTANTRDELIRALGPLLINKQMFFRCFRVLFSKGVLTGMTNLFSDRDAPVRRCAVKVLESYDILLSEPVLVVALEDTDEEVR